MPEDPIRSALQTLDRPVRPDPAFSETLFRRLVRESSRPPSIGRPRSIHRTPSSQVRRVLTIAAVLVGSAVLLVAVLGPLRDLGSTTTPADLSPATPFRMTLDGTYPDSPSADGPGDFRIRISYRDAGSWRIDVLGGSATQQPLVNENVHGAGSYVLWSNGVLLAFDAASGEFVPQPTHATWFSPLNLLGGADPRSGWERACQQGTPLGDDLIAGRPVRGMRCPAPPNFGSADATVEVWQDVETHLILKLVSGPDPGQEFPPGPIAWYPGESIGATSVVYEPVFADDAFAVPDGAASAPSASPSPILAVSVGDRLSLVGTTLEGRPFDLSAMAGEPTVLYLWADWCEPCLGTPLDALESASRERSDVHVVAVAVRAEPAAIRRYVADHGYTMPVVLPEDEASLLEAWGGPGGIPALVVVDASGRFAGAYAGWNAEVGATSDIGAILDAVASGDTLPVSPSFTSSQIS